MGSIPTMTRTLPSVYGNAGHVTDYDPSQYDYDTNKASHELPGEPKFSVHD
jgi:hypothetical protein